MKRCYRKTFVIHFPLPSAQTDSERTTTFRDVENGRTTSYVFSMPTLFKFLVGSCVALLPWYQQASHSLRHVVQMTLNATLALVGYPFRFRRCLGTPLLYFSLPASPTIRPRRRRGAGIQSFPGGHRYFSSFFFFFFVASLRQFFPLPIRGSLVRLLEVRLGARKMDISVSSFNRRCFFDVGGFRV